MTVPQCTAEHCAGVADDRSGLCAAHRRGLTLSTKMQDAVREFLHGNATKAITVSPTRENVETVERAGTLMAQALALLVSTFFGSNVSYDDAPISVADLSNATNTPWRVSFAWRAAMNHETWDADDDELDDDDESLDSDST